MAATKKTKEGAFVALALGAILIFIGLAIMQRSRPAENGVATTATVAEVEGRDRGVGSERNPQIRVTYEFDDLSGESHTFNRGWVKRPTNPPDVGDEASISYNSQDPSDAKLSSGSATPGWIALGLGVISLVVGAGWTLANRKAGDGTST